MKDIKLYTIIGLFVIVISLLVWILIITKSPPLKNEYIEKKLTELSNEFNSFQTQLDSIQKFRDTIKETIIKEKIKQIEWTNEIIHTNDIDSLITLFKWHFSNTVR